MKLNFEIETNDAILERHIFSSAQLSAGFTRIQISEGIIAKYNGTIIQLAVDIPNIIKIVIEIGKDVGIGIGSGLISAWLYEKLKGKDVKKIRIDGNEVELDQEQLQRTIEEKLKQDVR